MIRKNKIRPLYRHVIRDAYLTAWHEKYLWVLAVFAGILQTGGIVDVVLYALRDLVREGRGLNSAGMGFAWHMGAFLSASSTIAKIGVIENWVLGLMMVFAFLAFAVIAQGALVFGLGTNVRGKHPDGRTMLKAGARAFWPLVGLNVITLGSLWLARLILLIPITFAVRAASPSAFLLSIVVGIVYVIAAILFIAVHFFALNAMVLEDASLWHAWRHAYHVFKDSWLMVLETAVMLFVFSVLFLGAGLALFGLAIGPVIMLGAYAAFFGHGWLYWASAGMGLALFFCFVILTGAFTIAFQYGAWTQLYRRIGEGGVMAKLHRAVHWLVGSV